MKQQIRVKVFRTDGFRYVSADLDNAIALSNLAGSFSSAVFTTRDDDLGSIEIGANERLLGSIDTTKKEPLAAKLIEAMLATESLPCSIGDEIRSRDVLIVVP